MQEPAQAEVAAASAQPMSIDTDVAPTGVVVESTTAGQEGQEAIRQFYTRRVAADQTLLPLLAEVGEIKNLAHVVVFPVFYIDKYWV